jgi:protein-S-isoprenylcysteine O-methyltransferase Ste14
MDEKNGEHPFGDAGQLICFAASMVLWAGDSFFIHKTTSLAHYLPISVLLAFLGLALSAAFLLLSSAHFVVRGKRRPDRVIDMGAFRLVRHPLYLAGILVYLGLSVSTGSLVSLAVLCGIWVFYNYIAVYEERLLEIRFGEDYCRYKLRTGRWIPHIRVSRTRN